MNRLGSATSPYLLQHASNPVDWWPWGSEALSEAKQRDVPLLISVGYAACLWCHVMAHESFEDEAIGRLVNEGFVAIKVDREERPDVDAVYMQATQAMTGQGGWPMTVFATPDGQPFFCGTYFPKEQFAGLLRAVGQAWRDQRENLVEQGNQVVEAIAGKPLRGEAEMTPALLDSAAALVAGGYDQVNGGFGGAPKFPPHMVLHFLLRQQNRASDKRSLEIVRHTCEAMARGGIFDQVGGGFHRYTVDATWTVPHFEKMLYDNALLLRVYTELWRLTGDAVAARVAAQTAEFLLRDMRTPEGGFASALDADTDGVEGLTYAWNKEQLLEVLGEPDADWAADLLGVTPQGTFEHGLSVLQLERDIDDAEDELRQRWQSIREKLARARQERPQPSRDDKVVAAWNGMAITALVENARLTRREELAQAAVKAGELLRDVHVGDGRIRRVSRDGVAGEPAGVLEDYGCVAEAFCALHQLTGQGRWLELAGELLDTAVARFGNGSGGFYDTADDAQKLVTRPADPTDNATPSGLSSLVSALIAYSALTGSGEHRQIAQRALATVGELIARHPRFAGYSAAAAEALVNGPVEIAIAVPPAGGAAEDNATAKDTTTGAAGGAGSIAAKDTTAGAARGGAATGGEPGSVAAKDTTGTAHGGAVTGGEAGSIAAKDTTTGAAHGDAAAGSGVGGTAAAELVRVALWGAPGGAVLVVGEPDQIGVPLLEGRPLRDGQATAYVCRGFVCDRPVTASVELATMLRPLGDVSG